MPSAVVAEQTVHVGDTEEGLRNIGRFLIDIILLWIANYPGADQPVELTLCVGVGSVVGDQLGRHLVVGLSRAERILNPLIERVPACLITDYESIAAGIAVPITEINSPFGDPL